VPEESGRRGFLTSVLSAVGAVIALGYLFIAERFMLPPPASSAHLVKAGTLDDFPPNEPTLFIYTGESGFPTGVYIVNFGNGRVAAYDEHCAHLQCPVQWNAGAQQFLCPCHGSQYDIHGVNTGGPAPHPLDFHRVEIRNGNEVWIGGVIPWGTPEWNAMARALGIAGKWVPGPIPGTMRWSTNA
jgi:cytochrome b6-f complex iron-sulfur subunit